MSRLERTITIAVCLCGLAACERRSIPKTNSSYIDDRGPVHLTRVVAIPSTVSPEAQKWLGEPMADAEENVSVATNRANADKWQETLAKDMQSMYPTTLAQGTIAGVPVRTIIPPTIPAEKRDRVLINVHGGGFQATGIGRRNHPDRQLDANQGDRGLVPVSPDSKFPEAIRTQSRSTRAATQAAEHRALRYFGRRDPHRRNGSSAEAVGIASAGGAGHILRIRRLEPQWRLQSPFRTMGSVGSAQSIEGARIR